MSKQFPAIRPLTLERARELASNPARARLFDQIISATTQEQIDSARVAQHAWLMVDERHS